jgi:hypothetical protein
MSQLRRGRQGNRRACARRRSAGVTTRWIVRCRLRALPDPKLCNSTGAHGRVPADILAGTGSSGERSFEILIFDPGSTRAIPVAAWQSRVSRPHLALARPVPRK